MKVKAWFESGQKRKEAKQAPKGVSDSHQISKISHRNSQGFFKMFEVEDLDGSPPPRKGIVRKKRVVPTTRFTFGFRGLLFPTPRFGVGGEFFWRREQRSL